MTTPMKNKIDMRLFLSDYRRETFANAWPFDTPCSSLEMANAGFYCVSSQTEEPTAKCFVCEKELDGWTQDDVPFEEHRKHAPACLFIKKIKSSKTCSTLTVQDLLDLYKFAIETRLKKELNNTMETLSNFVEELKK